MKIEKKNLEPKHIAFIAAFIGGILIHMYGLVHVLYNGDNLGQYLGGFGAGATSGRWVLEVVGRFLNSFNLLFNLPWLNGVVFILFISISAYLLTSLFDVKDNKISILIGISLVAFPSVTGTILYRFTAPLYGLSIFLSVYSIYYLVNHKRSVISVLISSLLLCFSIGIYQAYLPVAITVAIIYLIKQRMNDSSDNKETFKNGVYYVLTIILGLIFYYLFLNLYLKIKGLHLTDYQGIDNMGGINIFNSIVLSIKAFFKLINYPINLYLFGSIYIILFLSILIIIINYFKNNKKNKNLMLLLMFFLLAVGISFINIMCSNSWVHTLMIYSYVFILIFSLLLIDWTRVKSNNKLCYYSKKIIIISVIIINVFYTYIANVYYTKMDYVKTQSQNYINSLVTQVRSTENFNTDLKWMIIGTINDPLTSDTYPVNGDLTGSSTFKGIIAGYSWKSFILSHIGYKVPYVSNEKYNELINNQLVKDMPAYPNYGSIKVIDDSVVIKLS